MERGERNQESVRELVSVVPGDEGTDRGDPRTDGPCRTEDRRVPGGYFGTLDSRPHDGLYRRTQLPVLGSGMQGPRILVVRILDHYALLRRRKTHPTVLLTH